MQKNKRNKVKIAGIGNALVDVLVHLPNETLLQQAGLPRGGMLLVNDEKREQLAQLMRPLNPWKSTGGSAGNTIKALSALGADCVFIGKTGDDDDDAVLLANAFQQWGTETRLIKGFLHTGVASTFISPTGERTFGTCLGAASTLQANEITEQLLSGLNWLHIEGYLVQDHALIERICELSKQMRMTVSMDLASYNVLAEDVEFARHLVQDYVDVVFANEDESRVFCYGKSPKEALREMADMCHVAVVKLGAQGAMARCGKEEYCVEAQCVKVADTTGAGDFFAAGFLYAQINGASLLQSLRCGTVMGEQAVQVVGTDLKPEVWHICKRQILDILRK